MTEIETLTEQWIEAKQIEADAREARLALERKILDLAQINHESFLGVERIGAVKISGKEMVSVDVETLHEVCADNGLTDYSGTLFRWKAELNRREWEAAPENVRAKLSAALTTKPSKPAFEALTKKAAK